MDDLVTVYLYVPARTWRRGEIGCWKDWEQRLPRPHSAPSLSGSSKSLRSNLLLFVMQQLLMMNRASSHAIARPQTATNYDGGNGKTDHAHRLPHKIPLRGC